MTGKTSRLANKPAPRRYQLLTLLTMLLICQACTTTPAIRDAVPQPSAYQHAYESYDLEFYWTTLYGQNRINIMAEVVNNYFLDFYDLIFYVSSRNKDGQELQTTSKYLTLLHPDESDVLIFSLPMCGDEASLIFTYRYQIASFKNDKEGTDYFIQELNAPPWEKFTGELQRMVNDYLQMKEINPIVTMSLALSATDHVRTIITLNGEGSCEALNLKSGNESGTCVYTDSMERIIALSHNSMIKSIRLRKGDKREEK
ncbi:MAG: hypothetical protein J7L69_01145 [Desulfobulbaceae bacterium]|nr:hypothetical protein [Desulfobulbaceae bacterium]